MHPFADLQVNAGHLAIHWFEQSTFAIKDARGTIVQVDPYYPRVRPAAQFIHAEPPLNEAELPTDYVLLTHNHGDHTCPESIERMWQAFPDTRFIGPEESIRQILADTSVDAEHVTTIHAGETVEAEAFEVSVVYAKPPSGDPAAGIDPPDVTHLGLVLKTDGVTLYFSGDPINTFAEHDELVQAVAAHQPDLGFLTNHPSEGEFPFFAGSVKMAQRIDLKHAAPSHYACFVTRDYDPQEWAAQFPTDGPATLIIPRNTHIVYPGA